MKGKFAAVCGLAAPTDAVFTHVEVLVADSHEALHAYLHGDAHLNVWIPLIKPNLEDIVVFDHDLPTPFTGVAGSQALSLLLKLRVDAEQEALASSAAMQLSLLIAGVSNVYFAPHGGGGLGKAALIDKLDWPDKSQGVTCTCTQLTQPPHLILPLYPPSPPLPRSRSLQASRTASPSWPPARPPSSGCSTRPSSRTGSPDSRRRATPPWSPLSSPPMRSRTPSIATSQRSMCSSRGGRRASGSP